MTWRILLEQVNGPPPFRVSDLVGREQTLRIHRSQHFLGDADAAGIQTTLWKPRILF